MPPAYVKPLNFVNSTGMPETYQGRMILDYEIDGPQDENSGITIREGTYYIESSDFKTRIKRGTYCLGKQEPKVELGKAWNRDHLKNQLEKLVEDRLTKTSLLIHFHFHRPDQAILKKEIEEIIPTALDYFSNKKLNELKEKIKEIKKEIQTLRQNIDILDSDPSSKQDIIDKMETQTQPTLEYFIKSIQLEILTNVEYALTHFYKANVTCPSYKEPIKREPSVSIRAETAVNLENPLTAYQDNDSSYGGLAILFNYPFKNTSYALRLEAAALGYAFGKGTPLSNGEPFSQLGGNLSAGVVFYVQPNLSLSAKVGVNWVPVFGEGDLSDQIEYEARPFGAVGLARRINQRVSWTLGLNLASGSALTTGVEIHLPELFSSHKP